MHGADARVDFREGGIPMAQGGSYLLVRGAEQQVVLVSPRDRQAMVLSAEALGSGIGAMTNNALIRVTMRDPRFAFEELGPGERLLGMPTRRVRIISGATTEARVFGRTSRTTDTTVTEVWIAPRPAGVDAAALRGWARSFGGGVRRTNAALAAQMAGYEQRYGDGLALRSVAVTRTADEKGRARVDTVRMEVTELSRDRVDPALFQMPAGYATADVGAMATAADSSRRADAAKDDAQPTPGGAVKDALGGMFKRRRP
jgi:hypothetical protein